MGRLEDHIARVTADTAAALAQAEKEAIASGKEPFSIEPLRAIYSDETIAARAESLRSMYYVSNAEMRTMAELVELLKLMETYQ